LNPALPSLLDKLWNMEYETFMQLSELTAHR